MSDTKIRRLRQQLENVLKKDRNEEALKLLGALESLEPHVPRWPHRRGDIFRKLGDHALAVSAYERAVDLYAKDGFIARAVAMAKTILILNPARVDILSRVDPSSALELQRRSKRSPLKIPSAVSQELLTAGAAKVPAEPAPAEPPKHFEDVSMEIEIDLDLSEAEVWGRRPEPASRQGPELIEEPTAESLALMPSFPLFAELGKERLMELATGADLVELPDGEKVVSRGDPADALYAIVEGSAQVHVPGLSARVPLLLVEGDVFGESCFFPETIRSADVAVFGRLVALRIPSPVLQQTIRTCPAFGDRVFELLTRRLIGNLLQTSSLFSAFDGHTRQELAKLFEVSRIPKGTILIERGQLSDGLYIPLTGRLSVSAQGNAPRGMAGPGAIFGQESLISSERAEATVSTAQDMAILRLPKQRFLRVAAHYPPVLAQLAELSVERGDSLKLS